MRVSSSTLHRCASHPRRSYRILRDTPFRFCFLEKCHYGYRRLGAASLESRSSSIAPSTDDNTATGYVAIGIIRSAHGVYGEMKVEPLTDFPEDRLGSPGIRYIQAANQKLAALQKQLTPQEIELEYGRTTISKGNTVWILKLAGVESPEDVASLKGHTLLIDKSSRPLLEDDDEFYASDLVGLEVVVDGHPIGRVIDIFDGTGTHDVLRVSLYCDDGTKQVLLPFAKEFVPTVDIKAGFIIAKPPEGLLELATVPTEKQGRTESAGKKSRRQKQPKKAAN